MLIFTAVSSHASTWSSEPRPFQVFDEAPVFDNIGFDTGYWPSATDPIAIRFYVEPDGGVYTSLFGTSELEWPSFAHRFEDEPGGVIELNGGVTIGSDISIDLLGIFTGTVTLVEERVGFEDSAPIDGLMLPFSPLQDGPTVTLGDDVSILPALDYAFNIVPGVDIVVGISVYPVIDATLSNASLSGATTELLWFQQASNEWVELEADPTRPAELGVVASWSADLVSVLSLVLEPSVSVSTAVGDFELLAIPIPIDLATRDERRAPEPFFLVHPLPVIDDLPEVIDFGEVQVGYESTYALPVVDTGELMLQGEVTVVGDGAFSSWPLEIVALPSGSDGITIGFAPNAPGPAEAEVWLSTNDPTRPLVKITLAGTGVTTLPDVDGPGVDSPPTAYCGCASQRFPSTSWPVVLAVIPLVLRRRSAARSAVRA